MLLLEGIRKTDDSFLFDFNVDGENEIIKLTEDVRKSAIYDNVFYYAYEFGRDDDSVVRTEFIHDLKFKSRISDRDKELFMRAAVNKFCLYENLYNFDCIVFPQSESELVVRMLEYIVNGCNADIASYELIKKVPKDIEFDYKKFEAFCARTKKYTERQKEEVLANINEMMNKIHELDYFSIARNSKYKYRQYLKNFYEFSDKETEEAYKSVSNKKVLLIDDIASSGTTIQMLLRSLNSLSTKEIVVFSLIGNGKMELL